MEIFGYEISKKLKADTSDKAKKSLQSFTEPVSDDGSTIVTSSTGAAGYHSHILNLDSAPGRGDAGLIFKYRSAASQPECDIAINDIVNASIVGDSNGAPVKLTLDDSDLPDKVKDLVYKEFDNVLKLLHFNHDGHDIFRRWYIDGKIYYHLMIDAKNPQKGIQEVRQVDPTKIQKIKEITKKTDRSTGATISEVAKEYYLFSDFGDNTDNKFGTTHGGVTTGVKVDPNTVVYVPSGITDDTGQFSVSHLHKSLRLVNQLRIMEDSLVIYRISRAPERRIFYIDIGNLPKGKAEEYVGSIMSKYRNKLVYNATTGEISDDRKTMSMLEDFWLPRREGGKGTEITTLPGGENLGQIDDILFFQKKLYRSLNVPAGRLEAENQFSIGRASEITRDEVKFQKFINRLRKKFSILFLDMLKIQCSLKGIFTLKEWPDIRESINIDYIEDNYFSELKEFEIMRERVEMLTSVESYIGDYFSRKWVMSNILNFSEQQIEDMQKEIDDDPKSQEPDDDDGF